MGAFLYRPILNATGGPPWTDLNRMVVDDIGGQNEAPEAPSSPAGDGQREPSMADTRDPTGLAKASGGLR